MNLQIILWTKISKIRNSLSNVPNYCHGEADTSVPSLESFEPLSQDEVKAIISDLGTKSCESDVIPTKLLKVPIPFLKILR